MLDQHDKIFEACAAIAAQWPHKPAVGIILGSGLGGVTAALTDKVTIPYESIPHFAKSTAHGHAGQLVCGLLAGVPVVVSAPDSPAARAFIEVARTLMTRWG